MKCLVNETLIDTREELVRLTEAVATIRETSDCFERKSIIALF
jgi:hypothetical protein